MSDEEKKPWFDLAAEETRKHEIKYPGYKFSPQHRSKAPKIPRNSVRRTAKCQALREDIASALKTGRDTAAAEEALKAAQTMERIDFQRQKRKDKKLDSTSRSPPTPSSGTLSSLSLSPPAWEPAKIHESMPTQPSIDRTIYQRPPTGILPAYFSPPTPDFYNQPFDFWNDDYQSSPAPSSAASSSRMTTCSLPAIVEQSKDNFLEQPPVWSNSMLFAQDGMESESTLQMIDDICSELNLVFARPPPFADEYERAQRARDVDAKTIWWPSPSC